MFDDVIYEESSFVLDPGDILAFYSDGISDTQNFDKEFYGTDRLADFIRTHAEDTAASIADRVLEQVELFSGTPHAFDDRTLVVFKVL